MKRETAMRARIRHQARRILLLLAAIGSAVASDASDNAPQTRHWAYQSLERPGVPEVPEDFRDWIRTPVDAFVLDAMLRNGLAPSRQADRRTLIRRLYIDLTGLPPSPEAVHSFVNDPDPQAWERLADRLLDSPRYGERWARHWLDVAQYADTHGYDKDKPRPHAWPYRDYVIRAFNQDKPYARFVMEQIAGDRLFPNDPDAIAALGFLAAGPWDFIGHVEAPETKMDGMVARNLDRDDMVSNAFNAFASSTVQCARCHDHKFDPVTQEQYYGMQSVFAALDRADRPMNLAYETFLERNRLHGERAEVRKRMEDKDEGENKGEPKDASALNALDNRLQEIDARLRAIPEPKLVYAGVVHKGSGNFAGRHGQGPRLVQVLRRGNIDRPGEPAVPGAFPVGRLDEWRFALLDDHTEGDRRAALARWFADRDNPLTWRSIVNRVWQHHFAKAIVDTPNDFGRMGSPPTHPRLMDWLAVEFRDGGQSLKDLHRLIINSSVYRQSSEHRESAAQIDAGNRWLWRMNRRRLDAETVRDAILQVSGLLRVEMGGPGFQLFEIQKPEHSPHYEYPLHDPMDPDSHRRSVYRFIVRSQPDPFLTVLDCADSSQSAPVRNETQTSIQSLALLNNRFIIAMSQAAARRFQRDFQEDAARIEALFRSALGRDPSPEESREWLKFTSEHGLENACRVVFNLNEFHYAD